MNDIGNPFAPLQPIIHIGLYKTASTWLQNAFFHGHPELLILHSKGDSPQVKAKFNECVSNFCFSLDPSLEIEAFSTSISNLLEVRYSALDERKKVIRRVGFSHEHFSGEFVSGRNRSLICNALHDSFPQAKIIFFVRNQLDMILSMYEQYVRDGGAYSIRKFVFEPTCSGSFSMRNTYGVPTNLISSLNYSEIISLYRRVYGKKNVYVGIYEDLRDHKDRILSEICEFVGVKYWKPSSEEVVNPLEKVGWRRFELIRLLNNLQHTRYHHASVSLEVVRLMDWLAANVKSNENQQPLGYQGLHTSIRIQRALSRRLIPSLPSCIDFGAPDLKEKLRKELGKASIDWLRAFFMKDNAQTAQLLNKDLKELGYSM